MAEVLDDRDRRLAIVRGIVAERGYNSLLARKDGRKEGRPLFRGQDRDKVKKIIFSLELGSKLPKMENE